MYRLLTAFALGIALVSAAPAQSSSGFDDARSFVGRVQSDLRHAADLSHQGKDRERFAEAQRHLSAFDKGLSNGKFDKGVLDDAIKDVQNVIDHCTLEPGDRDTLTADVKDLRVMREKRGSL